LCYNVLKLWVKRSPAHFMMSALGYTEAIATLYDGLFQ
jgi:hypothetical protein